MKPKEEKIAPQGEASYSPAADLLENVDDGRKSKIIFVGTGTSEGVPRISCLLESPSTCVACNDSMKDGSRNRRRNTSLLICYAHPDGGTRYIVIDVGKFFWHAALDVFVKHKIPRIDAVILTHEHHDASGGLDDLRDWTRGRPPIPVYLHQRDLDDIACRFPYLTNPATASGGGGVSSLSFRVLPDGGGPFTVCDLQFTPLPAHHGKCAGRTEDYICYGYRFGDVSYMSDTNFIPDATRAKMANSKIVILDSLFWDSSHPSHLSLLEAVDQLAILKPPVAYLTGMSHNIEHNAASQFLETKSTPEHRILLAYDSLCVPVDL